MSNPATSQWPQIVPRLDSQTPHLRILFVTIYVRDLERSIRFYVDRLGFNLIFDSAVGGGRFVVVGPPDGSAVLCFAPVGPDSDEYHSIRRTAPIVFLTENVVARYNEWQARGVAFVEQPHKPVWGGLYASLEDPDGNSLKLVESDDLSQELDEQRRTLAEKAEQERRSAQELEFAKQVQARLFPQSLPKVDSLDYAGLCLQARSVGGDYYDFLSCGPQRLGLVLGDISGKGMAAALLMANLQASVRAFGVDDARPETVTRQVNRALCRHTPLDRFVTFFYAVIDTSTGTLACSNAGHSPPILVRADGSVWRPASDGMVLGVLEHNSYSQSEVPLRSGDRMVLFTDGITEAGSHEGREFGDDRLVELAVAHRHQSAPELLDSLFREVSAFTRGVFADDATLISVAIA